MCSFVIFSIAVQCYKQKVDNQATNKVVMTDEVLVAGDIQLIDAILAAHQTTFPMPSETMLVVSHKHVYVHVM